MRVLILSCKTGGGHDSAGMAVKEEMERHGHEVVFLDFFTLSSQKAARAVARTYIEIVKKLPSMFGVIYKLGGIVSRTTKRSPVYYVNAKMKRSLEAYLEVNPVDVIVMPHLYPAETVSYMKRKGAKLPMTVMVMTDYTCIPFLEETDCDYYIVPHPDLIGEIVKRGIPKEKLLPFGIPVSGRFEKAPTREEARKQLGIPEQATVHLIVGGSMGAGNLMRLTEWVFLRCGGKEQIIVICGDNKKIEKKIRRRFHSQEGITVLGRVNQMEYYMKACDCMYTKPGGLTSTEAVVARVPFVHTKPIPGCETKNRKFFVSRRMSLSGMTAFQQASCGRRILSSEKLRQRIYHAQQAQLPGGAARNIRLFLEEKLEKK